ncbi:hypothetical protein BC826DRAFT_1015886 [Russula brevipes]|nr:hypothetical protein BC826DRAFT_1015886 [Russula brevipes]
MSAACLCLQRCGAPAGTTWTSSCSHARPNCCSDTGCTLHDEPTHSGHQSCAKRSDLFKHGFRFASNRAPNTTESSTPSSLQRVIPNQSCGRSLCLLRTFCIITRP